jgi:HEPN domain-containing protein
LKKVHDIEILLSETLEIDKTFEKYLDFTRSLTAYCYEERYPPGSIPSYTKEEVEGALRTAEEVIGKIRGSLAAI